MFRFKLKLKIKSSDVFGQFRNFHFDCFIEDKLNENPELPKSWKEKVTIR